MLVLNDKDIPEGIEQSYNSTDFEFVAFLMTYDNPRIRLYALIPKDDGYGDRQKYVFVIVGAGDEPDWYEKLRVLRRDYVNERTLVEPTRMAAKRKTLRGIVLDEKQRDAYGVRILSGRKG